MLTSSCRTSAGPAALGSKGDILNAVKSIAPQIGFYLGREKMRWKKDFFYE
jgi:hypothetical protein